MLYFSKGRMFSYVIPEIILQLAASHLVIHRLNLTVAVASMKTSIFIVLLVMPVCAPGD